MKVKSDIIQSKRTFGIEIELGNETSDQNDNLRYSIPSGYNLTSDSSMRVNNPVELVSPVLHGGGGAKSIIQVCKKLKKYKFHGDHISLGIHTHIGAKDFLEKPKTAVVDKEGLAAILDKKISEVVSILYINENVIKNHVNKNVTEGSYHSFAADHDLSNRGRRILDNLGIENNMCMSIGKTEKIGGKMNDFILVDSVDYYKYKILQLKHESAQTKVMTTTKDVKERKRALTSIETKFEPIFDETIKKKKGMYVVKLNDSIRLDRLKTLLYFYLIFDDVFTHMVSPSRRKGNSYCAPLADSYNSEEIESVKTYKEFHSMWYKNRNPRAAIVASRDHYNASRYHNLNLHSLFSRFGTVEIRSHGGTIDAGKILLWTALHQHIVDMIGEDKITLEQIKKLSSNEYDLTVKATQMITLLKLPTHLNKYVKRLLKFFSDLEV